MEIERASAAGIDAPAGIHKMPGPGKIGSTSDHQVLAVLFKDTTGTPDRAAVVTVLTTTAVAVGEHKRLGNSWVHDNADCARDITLAPPNGARIVLDQWDEEIDAVLSADAGGPTFESPRGPGDEVVTVSMDAAGNWSLSARPTVYPVHLIYFAETEIGNYTDSSKLVPEA